MVLPLIALVLAAGIGASHPVYPVAAHLSVTAEAREVCLADGLGAVRCVIVGGALQRAVEAELRAMFAAPADGAAPDLEIALVLAEAQVADLVDRRQLELRTVATVRTAEGQVICEVRASGAAPVLRADTDLQALVDRTAADAARQFRRAFANSEGVVEWLLARSIEPVESTTTWPRRSDRLMFADLGGALTWGGDSSWDPGLFAHVGLGGLGWVLEVVAGHWSTTFLAAPGASWSTAPAVLSTSDLGLEVGPVLRLGPAAEVRAGGGLHLLFGSAAASPPYPTPDYAFAHWAPGLFASVQTSLFPSRSGVRMRGGVELRKFFYATVGFPELGRTLPAASFWFGVFLGVEVPWGSPRPGGAP